MKRICIVVIVTMLVATLGFNAFAASCMENAEVNTVLVNVAERFLDVYISNLYLYTDANYECMTVTGLPKSSKQSSYLISGKHFAHEDLVSKIDFLKDKCTYWKFVRQESDIYRKDFEVHYTVKNIQIEDSYAEITISAMMSFQYVDYDQPSLMEDIYILSLAKIDTQWLVIDAEDEQDYFEITYRGQSNYSIDDILSEYATLNSGSTTDNIQSSVYTEQTAVLPTATSSTNLLYNEDNATAYAYTYTTSIASNTPEDFYNENFFSYASVDCMNFVSQCIWAGFGGNNTTSSIQDRGIPMDNVGSNKWYGGAGNTYPIKYWASCSNFRSYAANSLNATETGLLVVSGDISSTEDFSNYQNSLLGAVLHGPGSDSSYGHAVIITDVNGTDREDVYYCGHTSMAKAVKVAEKWNSVPLKILVPMMMKCSESITHPIVTVEMFRPKPSGRSLTLSSEVDSTCYMIQTKVTAPSGATSTSTRYNASTATKTYTFSEIGLYHICVAVKETSSSTVYNYYYTIRTY